MSNFFQEKGRSLLANGYRIIPITPGGKRPVSTLRDWPRMLLGTDDLARYPGAGVGIITGVGANPIVAIDIDTRDGELSRRFQDWCLTNLGPALVRVGDAPKTLLVYRAAEAGWSKGNSSVFTDVFDGKNQLEVLASGQQFVAYHIHPDTKRPYTWVGKGAADMNAAELTTLTLDQVERAIAAFNELARNLGMDETSVSRAVAIVEPTERGPRSDEDFFGRVNDAAMQNFDAWVPVLLPSARPYHDGYRVAQVDLGRDYEEDLSITPEGIKDWGVYDQGDEREGRRTPIDLVLEWAQLTMGALSIIGPFEAAQWLCEQLGAEPESLGFGMRRKRELQVNSDAMRAALDIVQQAVADADDMLAVHTTVLPEVRRILGEFPMLEPLAYAIVQARAKELDTSITKAEFHRLVKQERSFDVAPARQLTEFGNTERMLDRYGSGLMYVPDMAAWYVWNGNNWRKSRGGRVEIEHFAKETVRALALEADQHSTQIQEFYHFCAQSQQARMVANMVRLAESDPRVVVPASELDKHTHLLGVKNGVVDLRTGRLLPADPALHITLTAATTYDPSAKCPIFEQTLRDVFFDDMELVDYVCKAFGYALTGEPREDLMFIAYGGGSNGKSTIFNAARDVFGAYARTADASAFLTDGQGSGGGGGAREDILRLRGSRFVYVNEPDEGGELKEGMVKGITGGDAVTARGLYSKDSVEFTPTWTVFMPTNHKPIIKGTDDGIWRRMGMLPFERNFDNDPTIVKDLGRKEKIRAEWPGILAMLVRAAMRYKSVGLTPPAKVKAARDSYRTDMDLLAEWLDECCLIGPEYAASSAQLWDAWSKFALSRGSLKYISSSPALGRRLDAKFPARKGAKGVRMRFGIGIKPAEEPF